MAHLATVIGLGFSLAMDAFSVVICNAVTFRNVKFSHLLLTALIFGLMQGIMPIVGYYVASTFIRYLGDYFKWVAFAVILFLGAKMLYGGIKEAVERKKEAAAAQEAATARAEAAAPQKKSFSVLSVLVQGVVTSLDALIVGATLGRFGSQIHPVLAAAVIAAVTFAVCLAGAVLGFRLGHLFKSKTHIAEIIGGAALMLLSITFVI